MLSTRQLILAICIATIVALTPPPAHASLLDDQDESRGTVESPSFDPFRSAVPPEKVPDVPVPSTETAATVPAPEPPPLEVNILGFGFQDRESIVLVGYEGGHDLIEKGWTSADGHVTLERIVRPSEDRVELDLLDNRTMKRFTVGYDLGGKSERQEWVSREPADAGSHAVRR